jgi:hypothetical protein
MHRHHVLLVVHKVVHPSLHILDHNDEEGFKQMQLGAILLQSLRQNVEVRERVLQSSNPEDKGFLICNEVGAHVKEELVQVLNRSDLPQGLLGVDYRNRIYNICVLSKIVIWWFIKLQGHLFDLFLLCIFGALVWLNSFFGTSQIRESAS